MDKTKLRILKRYAKREKAFITEDGCIYWDETMTNWRQTYTCEDCGEEFEMMAFSQVSDCPFCDDKRLKAHSDSTLTITGCDVGSGNTTEWQKKKLGWYKNEKSWIEDIKGRKILPNGDIAVYSPNGKLKEVRPKGGVNGRPISKSKGKLG